jgi:hypothetical protein
MYILLSPAKSLNYSDEVSLTQHSQIIFKKEVNELINFLKNFSHQDLQNLMSISENLAQLNFERIKNFAKNFDLKNSKQSILVFDGDVYQAIEVDKYSLADFDFAQNNIRILSGLYGILRPFDLMQPYRLEMGTDFKKFTGKDFSFKNLYQFWQDKISDFIETETKEKKVDHILNLASEEYFKAVNEKKISAKIINIIFKENKNNQLKIIGINAKRARGLMTNFIVKNKIQNLAEIKKFNLENYQFSEKLSNANNLIFVR